MTESSAFCTRLRALDVCAVSDALDALGLPASVAGLKPLSVQRKITGAAVTVKLGTTPPSEHKRHLGTAAILACQAGDVIVVQQSTGIDCAGWGGVLCVGAQLKEVSGVIIEGPARDIDEARELGFPVYARSATATTARGRVYEQDFNCIIQVGDVEVQPGDYVIADGSAVAFVPRDRAEEVLIRAERIADRERLMILALKNGEAITEVMGKNYETMLEESK